MTRAKVSTLARVCLKTVDRAVVDGELPVAYYLANRPRFDEQEVYAWAERRKRHPKSPFLAAQRFTEQMIACEMSE